LSNNHQKSCTNHHNNQLGCTTQRLAVPAGRIGMTSEYYRAKLSKLRCESWGIGRVISRGDFEPPSAISGT